MIEKRRCVDDNRIPGFYDIHGCYPCLMGNPDRRERRLGCQDSQLAYRKGVGFKVYGRASADRLSYIHDIIHVSDNTPAAFLYLLELAAGTTFNWVLHGGGADRRLFLVCF